MNQQYPNGQGLPHNHPYNRRQQHPGPSSTNPQVHTIAASAHTLPPLNSPNYPPSLGHDSYSSRAQPLQPALLTSGHNPLQPVPVYAPTGQTYLPGQGSNVGYSQAPPASQTYRSSSSQYAGAPPPQSNPSYPASSQAGRLQDIRPMPTNNFNTADVALAKNGRSLASANPLGDAEPIHVVGSQGRRGILPSIAGRPPAIGDSGANGQKNGAVPAKDADGKYPCEFCTKTYLHAKHLKRHMLRHTGVRPYTCGLCRDTFSRSDILKRHFQKCSVRRGNPTGENHLSHSRANKKVKADEDENSSNDNTNTHTPTDQSQPLSTFPGSGFESSLDLRGLDLTPSGFPDGQPTALNQPSRANSIRKQKTSQTSSNRGSMGAIPASAFETGSYGYSSTGQVTPDSVTTSGAATPYTYQHDIRSTQISPDAVNQAPSGVPPTSTGRPPASHQYSQSSLPHIMNQANGRSEMDWHNTYPSFQHSQDEFGNSQYNTNAMAPHHPVKDELDFSSAVPTNMFHYPK